MRQKIGLITLGVVDFDKLLNFYVNGLNWKKSDKSRKGLALFDLGGIILALHSGHELENDTTSSGRDFFEYRMKKNIPFPDTITS